MFEVLVKPQEHIIDQGEDGDNFYVIERFACFQVLKWFKSSECVLNPIVVVIITLLLQGRV